MYFENTTAYSTKLIVRFSVSGFRFQNGGSIRTVSLAPSVRRSILSESSHLCHAETSFANSRWRAQAARAHAGKTAVRILRFDAEGRVALGVSTQGSHRPVRAHISAYGSSNQQLRRPHGSARVGPPHFDCPKSTGTRLRRIRNVGKRPQGGRKVQSDDKRHRSDPHLVCAS